MADDWQVGDLAMVIATDNVSRARRIFYCDQLRRGQVFTVLAVAIDEDGERCLLIDGPRSGSRFGGWLTSRFRKIRPHKADAEDRETIALLTGKPAQVPA